MIKRVVYYVFTLSLPVIVLCIERGSRCTTPNGEVATCVAARSCEVIIDAINTHDTKAIELIKASQCGYDTERLVCCGKNGYKSQRGESCLTPNNEQAKCVPIKSCNIIYGAITSGNSSVIEFAKESQCGYDSIPLVCCGTTAYLLPTMTTEADPLSGIFTKRPVIPPPNKPVEQSIILNNFETKALPDRTVCGLEKEAERVIGGTATDLNEYPWMAALEYKFILTGENGGIRCGASIINNRYLVTAAHCVTNQEFELIRAWLGEWRISTDPDCQVVTDITRCADKVKKIKIKQQIPHPFYSIRTGNNDIGLVRLDEDVAFTDYIRPICLPPPDLPIPGLRTLMTVAGWGIAENGTSSDVKLKVNLPLLPNVECNKKLSKPVTRSQLCAGGQEGKESCQGDSGGPLMTTYQDAFTSQSQWYLEGVVSSGVGCGRVGIPALYTRVSRYFNWIINVISDE